MSDLLFTVHQHGGDDVTGKPLRQATIIFSEHIPQFLNKKMVDWESKFHALV